MDIKFDFTIDGDPVAWKRPQYSGRSRKFYTHEKVRACQTHISSQAHANMEWGTIPEVPTKSALELNMDFYMKRPKSLPGKVTHHTKRPDAENLGKAVADALEDILYYNDSQVVKQSVSKQYGEEPGVHIWGVIREGET